MSRDDWKIRFGRIFQALLKESGKNLEDYYYFLPEGTPLDMQSTESYEKIDLYSNRELYNLLFSESPLPVPILDRNTATKLDATLVIVPGFGHHTIETRAFEEQMELLRDLGFELVYAFYKDSFESDENCAKRVYDIVKSEADKTRKIIFFTYSKGSPVIIELLSDPQYLDVTERTKAVVSIAGALRGSIHASQPGARLCLKLLKFYRKLSKGMGFGTKVWRKLLKWSSNLPFKPIKDWNNLVEKVIDFEDDLTDLPDGITDLTKREAEKEYKNVQLPDSIKLFSVSAVIPQSEFEEDFKFITNLDDLFLYVSGSTLYRHNVFNDTQVLLPDSEFFPDTGDIINLGIVKTDHWGIALSNVLSKNYIDPFPRTEMIFALLLTLVEYFNQH